MYDNIGNKIKDLATAVFIIEALASVVAGIYFWVETESAVYALLVFLGPFVAWISSWLLYGFGEIIVNLDAIEHHTRMLTHPDEMKEKEIAKKEEKKKNEEIAKKEGNVIVNCPECGEELFFDKELVDPECPYCGAIVKTKK